MARFTKQGELDHWMQGTKKAMRSRSMSSLTARSNAAIAAALRPTPAIIDQCPRCSATARDGLHAAEIG
jgi:hypothetical protein